MSFLKFCTLFGALALTAKVSAHGVVQGIVVNGVYSPGFNPSFTPYQNPVPAVAGWTTQDSDLGFVSDYSSPDIICHKSATPGAAYITVAAGESIELQWTVWPTSHKGPMIDYLASCNGDCTNVDKTALLFSKIDQAGLIDGSPAPGTWASDTMIANNNSWTVTIPPSIAPGKYVLRHETIALHSAENVGGSQAYPQCINLDITGSGTDSLTTGTLAEDFYTNTDPGILVNIYYPALTNYTIPGPPLLVGAVSASQAGGSPSPPPASSAAAAESAPASSSVPAAAATSSLWAPYANGTWTMTTPTSTPASTSIAPTDTATKDTSPTTSSTTITTTTTTVTLPPSAHASSWPSGMSPSPSPASSQLAVEFSPGAAWGPPAASSSSAPASSQIAPASSSEAAWGPPPAASSSPVAGTATAGSFSFSTTFTGRIGKPTKFTCYIDE